MFINKNNITEDFPLRIILGHELIQAHRAMTGTVGRQDIVSYKVDGVTYTAPWEELRVIGIIIEPKSSFPRRPITTENALRREQNLDKRRIYNLYS